MKEITLTKQQELNLQTLEMFSQKLESKLGYQPAAEVFKELKTSVWKSKRSRYVQTIPQAFVLTFETECYKLQLIPSSQNCVEVYWIEIKDEQRCKGIGSELMNTILDIADELNIKVKAVPCDMFGDGQVKVLYRIREWYRSLGFKPSIIENCVYFYTPNKVLAEQKN